MARKKHHTSHRRHGHHLSHAESERMLAARGAHLHHGVEHAEHAAKPHRSHSHHRQSMMSRYHEHAGEERHLHGYHPRRKYDTLRHERDMFNDEMRHDAEPVAGGPYHYDREDMEMHRLEEARAGRPITPGRGHYEGRDSRRHQEMRDAGMIHEDHREIANLPQDWMIKPYPMTGPYTPEDLDDTIRGVDRQMNYDNEKKMSHFYPKKV